MQHEDEFANCSALLRTATLKMHFLYEFKNNFAETVFPKAPKHLKSVNLPLTLEGN